MWRLTFRPLPQFQSLFSWNLPSELETNNSTQRTIMFQSLFSWNLPSEMGNLYGLEWKASCFNPCFLGTCPQSQALEAEKQKLIRFQSLFSWNLPSEMQTHFSPSILLLVSILVFLELALRVYHGYSGWDWPRVSILVFLELALREARLRHWCGPHWFQSLFSWNLPSEQSLEHIQSGMKRRFNPCFLGTCPQRADMRIFRQILLCFNPCFLGTCPQRLQFAMPTREHLSFNPCFLGTCPQRSASKSDLCICLVSILVFLELALRDGSREVLPHHMGVSILVFLELALRA